MRKANVFVFLTATLLIGADSPQHDVVVVEMPLWAGVSIPQPIWELKELKNLRIDFVLVNDGDKTVALDLHAARLVVNGQELQAVNFGAGPGERRKLDPGRYIYFGKVMDRYFSEPGTYRLQWKGKQFTSPEITFRVLPDSVKLQ